MASRRMFFEEEPIALVVVLFHVGILVEYTIIIWNSETFY